MINIRMNNVDHSSKNKLSPKITVVGIGGAGGNAVNNMISTNLNGVDFVVCNTDSQALIGNLAEHKVQLGTSLTEGLGAGAKPEIGRAAAEESLDDVMQYLEDANMAFITAGMGGGTGTGAAAVIAKACRERGILTVGVVTKPFHFEGSRRMKMAEEGLSELQSYVDTLIVIPNQNLFRVVNDKTTFADGFKMADSVLQSAVRGVTDLIVMPGLINLDFADIRSVMQEMGKAVMGAGDATGDNRATEAAEKAISNPLLDDVSMKGAKGVIVNITGGYDMTLFEVDEACNRIRDEVDPDANIIFGSTFDESLEGTIRVSVVATGIDAAVGEKRVSTTGRGSIGGFSVDRTKPAVSVARPVNQQQTPVAEPLSSAARAAYAPSSYSRQAFDDEAAPVRTAAFAGTRGTRMGESFIPPQPVETEGGYVADAYQQAMSPVSQQQKFFHQRENVQVPAQPVAPQHSVYEPQHQVQYQQQAPAQPQAQPKFDVPVQTRKKSPSLFERITGGYRRVEAGIESFSGVSEDGQFDGQQNAGGDVESTTGSSSGGMNGGLGLRAPQRTSPVPAQGRLNIDSPSAKQEEDELDIPAFLRRQTS
ncbi:MAG: cell division protein FtsZ [Alphaproteobacteria bacterium]|nr:cell division protein FtsZ [Alphaproteobacteria bacterium]MCB1551944.1 cell division protein FtsZ [Alphaproteobacteria bacterium]MCB9985171.1 cell division protein FtsZ [Micavibrio sp.]HPQ50685.1 cell division protein FtsZ [Alphaproteobacteria bacterium]HRK98065.1 cell division protein FtsZ [Alphaproteobacteria bacterium]